MRFAALLLTSFGLGTLAFGISGQGAAAMGAMPAAARAPVEAPVRLAEYYCSPGFEPTSGGRCLATASRDEIDLYVEYPLGEPGPATARRRHRRHGLRARY